MFFFPNGATSLWKVEERVFYLMLKLLPFVRNAKQVRLTIIEENLSFRNLLLLIQQKTGCKFFCEEGVLEGAWPVTMAVKQGTVEEILDMALAIQHESFTYSLNGKVIFLMRISKNWQIP
jgi:hypothetical protein